MGPLIQEAVKDLRGKVLAPAGSHVLQWGLKAVHSGEYLKRKAKFKESPQFFEDCQAVFEAEPYKKVLSSWTSDFKDWVGELWVPSACFEELRLLRMRDPYAYKHILTIAVVGCRLLELWVKTPPTVKRAFQAFLFHDLGRSRLSTTILEKNGTLDDLERRALYEHPLVGYVLNASYWADSNHLCAEVALHHNEDRSGGGYPQGIKTNSIILDILLLLDRFDAMISDRPFRVKTLSVREALDILTGEALEARLEPTVLKAFVALVRGQKLGDLKKIPLGTIGRPPKE